jgi:hypothetical protein
MYYDLLNNKLEVYLIPSINPDRANNGCCSRQVATSNPVWYRNFCSLFLDKRKKTIIKRKDILEFLNRLKGGKAIKSKYLPYLEDINETLGKELNMSNDDMAFFIEFGTFPEHFEDQF